MVEGIGPLVMRRLFQRFDTPERVLHASTKDLQTIEGIGSKLAGRIVRARKSGEALVEAQLALARQHALGVLLPDRDG